MPIGLSVAIALLAQAAAQPAYGPTPPPAAKPKAKLAVSRPEPGCRTPPPRHDATEIVVCAERPQGYRLDPDVRTAKRGLRNDRRGKPTAHMKDYSCASVGPAGCIGAGAGVNLLGAALTAVQMAGKAARGENVGSMFVTNPEPTEYQLYLAARRQREADEAVAAATARSAAKAPAAAGAVPNP